VAPHIALSVPVGSAKQTADVATVTAIAVAGVTTAAVTGYTTAATAAGKCASGTRNFLEQPQLQE
jgi:hypothetical protein